MAGTGRETSVQSPRERPARNWFRWLLVAVLGYVVAITALSELRQLELVTNTLDLGVYQQALWSTAHGRPFFEAADWELGNYGSLLEVHSLFILYAVVPVYAAFPNALTLFVIQSTVAAIAAIPLYALTRDLTSSPRRAFVAGLVYLTWFPMVSANLYDFHVESFVPLEIFLLVLLWQRRRYAWGAAVAVLGFATLEVVPVFVFFVGLYFVLDALWPRLRPWLERVLRLRAPTSAPRASDPARARRALWCSFALMVASIAAYYLLVLVRTRFLEMALALPPFPSSASSYPLGTTPSVLGLAAPNLATGLFEKAGYWLLVAASLGFVPFLAPRALLVVAPWFAFCVFSTRLNYVVVGNQYGFLAAAGMFVAFAYGLGRVDRWWVAWSSPRTHPGDPPRLDPARRAAATGTLAKFRVAAFLVGVLVVGNLFLTPINPGLDGAPTAPLGAAFLLEPGVPHGFSDVQQVVAEIPSGATVLASRDVFPLVANDVNAYSMFGPSRDLELQLPFTPSAPPQYVVVSDSYLSPLGSVPPWLLALLYNSSFYGVRSVAWDGPSGVVVLFEEAYKGRLATVDAPPVPSPWLAGVALLPAADGAVVTDPSAVGGSAVVSSIGVAGVVWNGPGADVPAGNYNATVWIRASPGFPGQSLPPPSTIVARLSVNAYGQAVQYSLDVPYSSVSSGTWTPVRIHFAYPEVILGLEVRGAVQVPSVQLSVESCWLYA
ncbi:MAG TPA: DUF2079 domain-containing protein [Thermoplasmata archaeon]|nr:DUF2079 domain-containing protein [Thermoplasmata archaeon]